MRTSAFESRLANLDLSKVGQRTLQVAIVLLGASVDLPYVLQVAAASLAVMLGTLILGLGGIVVLGRILKVDRCVRGLLAVGTSICGASAITAVAPLLGASDEEVNYAVAIIFLFNISAVATFPVLGHLLRLSPEQFGLWAGTAVNDTSSVLAAGYAFGAGAAAFAAVVKLVRTMCIVPVSMAVVLLQRRTSGAEALGTVASRRLPWFVIVFGVGSAACSLGLWPKETALELAGLAQGLTVVALAAIGLSTDLWRIMKVGVRPVLLGFTGWLMVASASLALQNVWPT